MAGSSSESVTDRLVDSCALSISQHLEKDGFESYLTLVLEHSTEEIRLGTNDMSVGIVLVSAADYFEV